MLSDGMVHFLKIEKKIKQIYQNYIVALRPEHIGLLKSVSEALARFAHMLLVHFFFCRYIWGGGGSCPPPPPHPIPKSWLRYWGQCMYIHIDLFKKYQNEGDKYLVFFFLEIENMWSPLFFLFPSLSFPHSYSHLISFCQYHCV